MRFLRNLFILGLLQAVVATTAAADEPEGARVLSPGRAFFVPHWYVKAQGGAAVDVGEATFEQLVSPALQLSAAYRFTEYFGLRGSVSADGKSITFVLSDGRRYTVEITK